MEYVGVREARQHLSKYLERVKAGESFTVTEHGHAVAVLAPIRDSDDPLAEYVAAGIVEPRKPNRGLPDPIVLPPGRSLQELLDETREERDL